MIIGDVGSLDARCPDHSFSPEGVEQEALDFSLVALVAIAIDPAAFMRHRGAGAIDLDAAGLAGEPIRQDGKAKPLPDAPGDLPVVGMALLVTPAIEAEIGDGERSCCPRNGEGRAGIAAPEVLRRDRPDLDSRSECFCRGVLLLGARQHDDRLEAGDRFRNRGDRHANGVESVLAAIDAAACRPLHERPLMWIAFE